MPGTFRHTSVRDAMEKIEHRDWRLLLGQTQDPGMVQRALLQRILAYQAPTTFGRKYDFAKIESVEDYRKALPIHGYEDLRPHIEGQEKSREPLLNVDQPLLYAQTSGTTGTPKLVPILVSTQDRIARFQRLFSLVQYRGVPRIYDGRLLVLSGQPIEGRLPTGTAYGSMSGLMFEGLPPPIKRKDILPRRVRSLTDVAVKYRQIAALALAEPSLSAVATPNPSTLLKLMEIIRRDYAELVEGVASGRGRGRMPTMPLVRITPDRLAQLRSYVGHAQDLTLAVLWPKLRGVVTWTGGNCGVLIPRLRALLPAAAAIVEMGYLSSECLGSLNVDVTGNRCVPTFWDHVFEFVPLAEWDSPHPDTLLLEQLEIGEKYHVLVTTPDGLYRYAMNDIVEVTGRFNATPTIRFVQKGKGVTNITGEKLYEHQAVSAIDAVLARHGLPCEFYVLIAEIEEQRYVLYLEQATAEAQLGEEADRALAEQNVEYKAKRGSDRLRPLVVRALRPGTAEAYRAHHVARGQRDAQFKLVRLQYGHECLFDFAPYMR